MITAALLLVTLGAPALLAIALAWLTIAPRRSVTYVALALEGSLSIASVGLGLSSTTLEFGVEAGLRRLDLDNTISNVEISGRGPWIFGAFGLLATAIAAATLISRSPTYQPPPMIRPSYSDEFPY